MKLAVFKGSQRLDECTFDANKGPIIIGRADNCDLVLDDKRVSREHAQILFENNEAYLLKKTQYESLLLNGESVEKAKLSNFDQIQLPPYVLHLSLEEGGMQEASQSNSILIDENDNKDESSEEDSQEFIEEDDFTSGESHDQEDVEQDLSEHDDFDEANLDEPNLEEDDFDDDYNDFAMEAGDKTQVAFNFARYQLVLEGEYSPYDTFNLDVGEVLIGRNPSKVQIELQDPEVSSVHAKITRVGASCSIEDMDSGNGTILNGKRVNKSTLQNGDEFLIGSTSFKLQVSSSLIESEKDRLMPVETNQAIEIEEIVEVLDTDDSVDEFDDQYQAEPSKAKTSILKDPEKRRKLLIGLVVLMALWLMFEDDSSDSSKKAKSPKDKKESLLLEEKKKAEKAKTPEQRQFTEEEIRHLDSYYLSAKSKFERGLYTESLKELDEIFRYAKEYKNSRQIQMLSKQALAKIEELRRKKQEEIDRKIREAKVQELLKKAADAVDKKDVLLAENFFNQIAKLTPENQQLDALKNVLEIWKRQEEQKKVAAAAKKAERERMLQMYERATSPYNRGEWYQSIIKLSQFLRSKGIDEDLLNKAKERLDESKKKLDSKVQPLVGRARSLKEAQDLKAVYQTYVEVLRHDPANEEALNEIAQIREGLINRAKIIYREALISESMSLFDEARDHFKEVLQVSPEDSEYYKKASERLKNYID